nr:11807_t:CDS:2 [Entrophospora candida]
MTNDDNCIVENDASSTGTVQCVQRRTRGEGNFLNYPEFELDSSQVK